MRELTVDSSGVSLAVRAWGVDELPSVVLVHGHGTNLMTWGPLVEELSSDFHVVAYDRRGHGHSGTASSFTLTELAADLEAVCDSMHLVAPILVGHSVGVWDVLEFAAGRSEITGVVCLDQAIATDDPMWPSIYPKLRREDRQAVAMRDPIGSRGHSAAGMSQLIAEARSDPRWHPWGTYGPMIERGISPSDANGLFWTRPGVTERVLIEEGWESVRSEPYDRICCPVLLALADRNTGPAHEMFMRLASRRRLVAVAVDSDHDVHLDQPGVVADLVRALRTPSTHRT